MTRLNVHIKLSPAAREKCIEQWRNINGILGDNSLNLIDFEQKHEPHVTLYLSNFKESCMERIKQVIRDRISELKSFDLTLSKISPSGSYLFWDVEPSTQLRNCCDNLVHALSSFVDSPSVPSWFDRLPAEERARRSDLIEKHGSATVFEFFYPHVTLAYIKDEAILTRIVELLEPCEVTFAVAEIAIGMCGDQGTVLKGQDVCTFPIDSPLLS
eukprot:GILK01008356.1.p1 GENE.GILK01008356.1~~GILK01008356.1.p1  ORF type:complete len:214 (-),score=19.28 GILK01008356.1:385-1026(-)